MRVQLAKNLPCVAYKILWQNKVNFKSYAALRTGSKS